MRLIDFLVEFREAVEDEKERQKQINRIRPKRHSSKRRR